MPIYNLNWQEVCNVQIEAENEQLARLRWQEHAYSQDDVFREALDQPEITLENQ